MNNFIVVTYWWGRGNICNNSKFTFDYLTGEKQTCNEYKYEEIADEWIRQMKDLSIEYYIEELHDHHDYQSSISYKPTFIKKCIQMFNKPVLYLDLDMKIHSYPYIFENNFFDFMAFNWNVDIRCVDKIDFYTFETSGGIMYFNSTKNSMQLLDIWIQYLQTKRYFNKADDRVLAIAFQIEKAIQWCKCYWLPLEYFVVPQFYSGLVPNNEIIISHPSRITDEVRVDNKRIPSNYDFIIKCKSYKGLIEFQNMYFKDKDQLEHLRKLNTLLENKKIKKTVICKDINFNFNSTSNVLHIENHVSAQQCLDLFLKGYTGITSDITIKNNFDYDIIFDKQYNILFVKFNEFTIRALLYIDDFKRKKNISLILGISYSIQV